MLKHYQTLLVDSMQETDSLITIKDAASMLGVTKSTLRNWDKNDKLNPIRNPVNNYRMYQLTDVISIIDEIKNNRIEIDDTIPPKRSQEKHELLHPIDTKKLKFTVRQMSKAFRDSEGGSILDRFEEISKLLFCKLFDEQEIRNGNKNNFEFSMKPGEDIDSVYEKINSIFERAMIEYPTIFINSRNKLSNDKKAIVEIVKLIQNYDLSKTPEDVKGVVYEEIIRNTFEKNENQQFFTPRRIVEFMIHMINPTADELVCDPACGSGGFLIDTLLWVKKNDFRDNSNELKDYCEQKIMGVEIDSRMVWISNMNIIMHGGVEGVIKYIPNGGSLGHSNQASSILKTNSFDIVITNPPFGSDFTDEKSLKKYIVGKDRTSRRRGVLFVEKCLEMLKPDGRLAIILEESIFNGTTNSDVRELVFNKSIVEAVISLPEVTFLPYSSAKASILFLRKKSSDNKSSQKEIFMANVENVGHRPNGDPLYGNERDEHGRLQILNDLPKVVEAWGKFQSEGRVSILDQSPSIFICEPEEFLNEKNKLFENRLDVQFYHPTKKLARDIIQKSIYPTPTLAELVVERSRSVLPKIEFPDENCRFIGLANISPNTGEFFFSEIMGDRIKSSVRYCKTGDVLFSKLRPELRKCVFIDDREDEGYTSSECFVFRALDRARNDPDFTRILKKRKKLYEIDSEYLAYILRSDIVYGQIVYQITGVGRPRISKSAILGVKIPLPPINEQKEIVGLFKETFKRSSNLKKQSQIALVEADEIIDDIYNFVEKKLCPD